MAPNRRPKPKCGELQRGRSILDTVLGEASKLQHDLGHQDREKLDEYLTAVRDLELATATIARLGKATEANGRCGNPQGCR